MDEETLAFALASHLDRRTGPTRRRRPSSPGAGRPDESKGSRTLHRSRRRPQSTEDSLPGRCGGSPATVTLEAHAAASTRRWLSLASRRKEPTLPIISDQRNRTSARMPPPAFCVLLPSQRGNLSDTPGPGASSAVRRKAAARMSVQRRARSPPGALSWTPT